MHKSIRCLITGRVQGVFFRASTRREAQRLKISGYAKNLPDGRVEVLACGDGAALAELQAWLSHGPAMAEVERIHCEQAVETVTEGFLVL